MCYALRTEVKDKHTRDNQHKADDGREVEMLLKHHNTKEGDKHHSCTCPHGICDAHRHSLHREIQEV